MKSYSGLLDNQFLHHGLVTVEDRNQVDTLRVVLGTVVERVVHHRDLNIVTHDDSSGQVGDADLSLALHAVDADAVVGVGRVREDIDIGIVRFGVNHADFGEDLQGSLGGIAALVVDGDIDESATRFRNVDRGIFHVGGDHSPSGVRSLPQIGIHRRNTASDIVRNSVAGVVVVTSVVDVHRTVDVGRTGCRIDEGQVQGDNLVAAVVRNGIVVDTGLSQILALERVVTLDIAADSHILGLTHQRIGADRQPEDAVADIGGMGVHNLVRAGTVELATIVDGITLADVDSQIAGVSRLDRQGESDVAVATVGRLQGMFEVIHARHIDGGVESVGVIAFAFADAGYDIRVLTVVDVQMQGADTVATEDSVQSVIHCNALQTGRKHNAETVLVVHTLFSADVIINNRSNTLRMDCQNHSDDTVTAVQTLRFVVVGQTGSVGSHDGAETMLLIELAFAHLIVEGGVVGLSDRQGQDSRTVATVLTDTGIRVNKHTGGSGLYGEAVGHIAITKADGGAVAFHHRVVDGQLQVDDTVATVHSLVDVGVVMDVLVGGQVARGNIEAVQGIGLTSADRRIQVCPSGRFAVGRIDRQFDVNDTVAAKHGAAIVPDHIVTSRVFHEAEAMVQIRHTGADGLRDLEVVVRSNIDSQVDHTVATVDGIVLLAELLEARSCDHLVESMLVVVADAGGISQDGHVGRVDQSTHIDDTVAAVNRVVMELEVSIASVFCMMPSWILGVAVM